MIRSLSAVLLACAFSMTAALPAQAVHKDRKHHHLAIHVDDKDPAKFNLALNNARNLTEAYSAKGEEVEIEIVTYGPGLHMLRADTSPVAERIKSFEQSMPNVSFSACANTMAGMKRTEGKEITLLPEAKIVPSGVVRLLELQEQGWAYLRP